MTIGIAHKRAGAMDANAMKTNVMAMETGKIKEVSQIAFDSTPYLPEKWRRNTIKVYQPAPEKQTPEERHMELEIAQIVVPNNRRPLRDTHQLADSIKDIGLLNPITVKDMNTNTSTDTLTSTGTLDTFRLVAGFHRLEACKALGWQKIPARIVALDGLKADLTLKAVASPHTIQREVQIATRLSGEVKSIIRETPLADSKTELIRLARIVPASKMEVVQKLLLEQAKTFREVEHKVRIESLPRVEIPQHEFNVILADPIEQQLLDEGHLRETTSISNVQYLSPWLTTHQVGNKNRVATGDLSERHLDALPGIVIPSQLSSLVSSEAVRESTARIVIVDKFPCKTPINCTNLPIVKHSEAAKGWQLPASLPALIR